MSLATEKTGDQRDPELLPRSELEVYSRVDDRLFQSSCLFHITPLLESYTVQAEVIPAVLESVNSGLLIGQGGYRPRDICVSAPTGSGKTLAFVIPVVQVRPSVHNNYAF